MLLVLHLTEQNLFAEVGSPYISKEKGLKILQCFFIQMFPWDFKFSFVLSTLINKRETNPAEASFIYYDEHINW